MFCSNCGTQNEEGAVFCSACGAKMEEAVAVEETVEAVETAEAAEPIEATETVEAAAEETVGFSPMTEEFIVPKKKGLGFGKIAIIAVAAVAVLGTIGAFAKDAIWMAASPQTYTASVVGKTFQEIEKESKEAEKNLLGFNMDEETAYTVGVSGTVDDIPDASFDSVGIDAKAGVDPKAKEMMVEGSFSIDDEVMATASFFLNDTELGFIVDEIMDEYAVVPSKEFGSSFNDSDLRDYTGADKIDDELDLSFSELYKEEELTDETKDKLKELQKTLGKNATIENKEKAALTLDGKSRKVQKYDIVYDGDELKTFLIDSVDVVMDDANLKSRLDIMGETVADSFDDEVDYMLDSIDEYLDLEDKVEITVYEYKGQMVSLAINEEISIDGEDAEIEFQMTFPDTKNILNEVEVLLAMTVEGETLEIEMTSKGNHMAEDNKYTDETVIIVDIPYEDEFKMEFITDMDFKKETFSAEMTIKAEGETGSIALSGSCNKKDGISFTFNELTVDIPYEAEVSLEGEVTLTLQEGMKLEKKSDSSVNLFTMSESDLEDWAYEIEENAMTWAEDVGETLGYSSYYDDYYDDYYYDDYYDDYYYDDYYYDDYYDDYYYDDYSYDDYYDDYDYYY